MFLDLLLPVDHVYWIPSSHGTHKLFVTPPVTPISILSTVSFFYVSPPSLLHIVQLDMTGNVKPMMRFREEILDE